MSTAGRTRYPVYTFLSAVVVYGIALGVYSSFVGERWAEWFASAFFWALLITIYTALGTFVYRVFTQPLSPWDMFFSVVDFYFAFLHAQAGLGMTIYLLDTSVAKNTWFLTVNTAASPYSIYVGDFLLTTTNIFNTAGWTHMIPRPSTVLGPLWGMFIAVTGWFYVLFVLGVVTRSIKKASPLSEKVMEKANKVRARILPSFRADYAGVTSLNNGDMGTMGLSMRELPSPNKGVKRAVLRHQRKTIRDGGASGTLETKKGARGRK